MALEHILAAIRRLRFQCEYVEISNLKLVSGRDSRNKATMVQSTANRIRTTTETSSVRGAVQQAGQAGRHTEAHAHKQPSSPLEMHTIV